MPLGFRFHQPSLKDLEARLREIECLDANSDMERAAALAGSVAANLTRFFPPAQQLPAAHLRLRDRLLAWLDGVELPGGESIRRELLDRRPVSDLMPLSNHRPLKSKATISSRLRA